MPDAIAETTSPAGALRISSFDPLDPRAWENRDALFARMAALGFGHVMVAPPFATTPHASRLAPLDLDHADASLEVPTVEALLRELSALAAGHGLSLLLDISLDRVDAASTLAGSGDADGEALFALPDPDAALDPRLPVDLSVAVAAAGSAAQAQALGRWWAGQLAGWRRCGVAGFRLFGLASLPPASLLPLLSALRGDDPSMLLIGWTPGMAAEAVEHLRDAGLDAVACSLPWWDFSAGWLWDELRRLRAVAPVLAAVQAPFPPSGQADARPGAAAATQDPADRQPARSRALALAAVLGAGWIVPHGELDGPTRPRAAMADRLESGADEAIGASGLEPVLLGFNRLLSAEPVLAQAGAPVLPCGGAGPVLALLRGDADLRVARKAVLLLLNTDLSSSRSVDPSLVLPALGGRFGPLVPGVGELALRPGEPLTLRPGEAVVASASALPLPEPTPLDPDAAAAACDWSRIAIEQPAPAVDGGLFPVKRLAGETVRVEADVICDGHDKTAVALQWTGPNGAGESRMRPLGNDRWRGEFALEVLGAHAYRIQAWRDAFATFRDELGKKHAAGVPIELEMIEGTRLVEAAAARIAETLPAGASDDIPAEAMAAVAERLRASLHAMQPGPDERREVLLSEPLAADMRLADDRPFASTSEPVPVDAERIGASYANWYEVFPRSMSDDPARHGTFADVERHLPRVRAMGFDVLYFPPIHPIGRANRKGPNNTLTPGPDDPGSPYAIGSEDGGHDALHPQLGTLEDFRHLVAAAAGHGIEIAIDFAVQCSPDHPWLKQHRGWFDWRPDGSIKYAENPPKKYQDIVNVDFYGAEARPSLWLALAEAVLFWAALGVRLFRVDNPHTKPLPFWQWMIGEVRARYPDAVFLAEAFTRPKVMYRLAKVGFSQSYTYFTWRNEKRELQEYLEELADTAPRDFFRPHFFVNTPDINPVFLQTGGRPAHLIRAALAATLSGLWGVYSGFELCDATPLPGREEYLDSEKYQLRAWDWQRPGNIVAEVTQLNALRAANPALRTHLGVTFRTARNDSVLFYEKATDDRSNVVLVCVSLDPYRDQAAELDVPLWAWGLPDDASVELDDLRTGARFTWTGRTQRVYLPSGDPYAIWRLRSVT